MGTGTKKPKARKPFKPGRHDIDVTRFVTWVERFHVPAQLAAVLVFAGAIFGMSAILDWRARDAEMRAYAKAGIYWCERSIHPDLICALNYGCGSGGRALVTAVDVYEMPKALMCPQFDRPPDSPPAETELAVIETAP